VSGWREAVAWLAVALGVTSLLTMAGNFVASGDPDAWAGLWHIASLVAGWYVANRVVDQ
jgi:hypothetical protein